MITVRTYAPQVEVLTWLQTHVGELVESQPIRFWRGEGWHMVMGVAVTTRGNLGKMFFDVEFTDEKYALMFTLRWC